jgi:proton-translocating NADH-quinone oxidoreductase chain M
MLDKIVGGYDKAEKFNLEIVYDIDINFLIYEIIKIKKIILNYDNWENLLNIKLMIINSLISIILLIYINNKRLAKNIGIFFSFLNLIITINFYIQYDYIKGGYQFIEKIYIMNYIYFELGVDSISIFFIILSILLIIICILLINNIKYKINNIIKILKIIELILILIFVFMDLVGFYLFFELILFPILLLIFNWGMEERRVYAGKYFFLITFYSSLFMLIGIIYLLVFYNISDFRILEVIKLSNIEQRWLSLLFFFSLAVKIPIYPLHMWLPEAHVEAPTIGSVLLAGILLKLGYYGLIRISFSFLIEGMYYYGPILLIFLSIGIINSSLTTLCQVDLKRIIAYSSIAHMNFGILGLFAYNYEGIIGSFFLMISHGIVASALFICVGILYERYKTRVIFYYNGIIEYMPLLGIFFFIFLISNMGIPLSSNFIGEFLIFFSFFEEWKILFFFCMLSILISCIYSLWLYNRIFFGKFSLYISLIKDINRIEYIILIILVILNIYLGIYPKNIIYFLDIKLYI